MDAHAPRQHWLGTTAVVSVSGALDLLTSPALEQLLTDTLQAQPAGLIVDLTEVNFLSSAGMQVLVNVHAAPTPDVGFVVVADGRSTSRPLALVGLTEVFDVVATLQAAVALLS